MLSSAPKPIEPHVEPTMTEMNSHSRQLWIEICKAQLSGQAALPYGLGLDMAAYHDLVRSLESVELDALENHWNSTDTEFKQRSHLYNDLLVLQAAERNQLIELLMRYLKPGLANGMLMAIVVASACLASGHLWKSLGLSRRARLRELMTEHFPELVQKNDKDMRWKRFLYRCLCENGGDYVCKAPNCVDCTSYSECFSPEE